MSGKLSVNLFSQKAEKLIGCRISSGELLPAPAPELIGGYIPEGIIFAGYSKSAERFFLCAGDTAYVSGNGEVFISLHPLAGDSPFMVEEVVDGTARAVMINGKKAVLHTGEYFMGFEIGVELCCGVMHCGRLFGADKDDKLLLRWSGGGGTRDWAEGLNGSGSLKLDPARGSILNVLEYGGKLVAVREYGLTVLSMYGAPENFSVDITDTDTDGIFKNTAKVVGGKLFFYTASGLHFFDGSAINKAEHIFTDDIISPVSAASFGDLYLLICKSKSLNRKVVFCYGAENGESYLMDFAADAICTSDKVYLYNSSGVHMLGTTGNFAFTSGEVNFGTDRFKTVESIYVDCASADVEISNGRISRKFKNASGTLRPRMRGKSFVIKVEGANPVSAIKLTAEVCDGI